MRRRLRASPSISVDTKKKELIGNYRNGGTDYRPKGDPRRVKVHDFENKELGKIVPYGVYDVTAECGLGQRRDHERYSQFAVASIRRWLDEMGRERYPHASELDYHGRLRRLEWSARAVVESPATKSAPMLDGPCNPRSSLSAGYFEVEQDPSTAFCRPSLTQTWRGRPLTDRTGRRRADRGDDDQDGLKVESALDTRTYEKGIKVSDAEMKTLDINGDPFHPEWNYTIRPRSSENRSG